MTTPEPRLPGVSTRDAAIMLGISQSDVLRRIKRGALKAERFDRPGGTILRVLLDPPDAAPSDTSQSESEATPEPRQDASEAIRILEDRLAFADALIVANGATFERQDARIDALHTELRAESAARARAEERAIAADRRADQAERERAALQAERDRLAAEAAERQSWGFWRRLRG